jgi:hypothetical protein
MFQMIVLPPSSRSKNKPWKKSARSKQRVWLRIETVTDFFENGNELSESIKCWELLEWLSDC